MYRYFDETDRSFTLGLIIQMKMQKHGEQISEISNKATMELNIENVNDLLRTIYCSTSSGVQHIYHWGRELITIYKINNQTQLNFIKQRCLV